MKKKRVLIVSQLLVLSMIASMFTSVSVFAVNDDIELQTDDTISEYEGLLHNENTSDKIELFSDDDSLAFTDVSDMSDEDFFGVWNSETNEWDKKGKLNYDYSSDLTKVERLVKQNSYAMAKDELLTYFKNKTMPVIDFAGSISWRENYLYMKDAYAFEEPVLGNVTITDGDEYKEYTVDLLSNKSAYVFLISSLFKTNDMVCIASRESSLSPTLEIREKGGSVVTLSPTKDTYIRAYDNEEDYSAENYGDSEELYVKDSYYQLSDGTYKPYSSKTRRTYIAFDSNQMPDSDDIDHMYLKFYAKIMPEEGTESTSKSSQELTVFEAYNKSWDEKEAETNQYEPMTWADYKISHYSWNGLPGGFDWQMPDNVPSEWLNYNTRFYNIVSMTKSSLILDDKEYMEKAISDVLDFIKDTNGSIISGTPAGRDIESANRTSAFPAILYSFIESDMFNGEALTAMLKWIWEETTYLYNGAGILYQGTTALPTDNNYAETNRGVWHCAGFEAVCTYFPEYADRSQWKPLADERLEAVTDVLIGDDGCYNEATFAYGSGMLDYYVRLNKILNDAGDTIPDWFMDSLGKFARYIMYISYPDRVPPKFGEGVSGETNGILKSYLTLADDEEIEYVVTDGEDGVEPEEKSVYFEGLKLASCRTSWARDASMLLMQAKNGGNHNHKDSLAILYYSGDRDLIADTGMTSYDSGHPHYMWQRHTTRSHNTIEIDETPQRGSDFFYNQSSVSSLKNGEASLDLYEGEQIDRINAWTDATEGFRHYRNVSYIKNQDFMIVSDMVHPSDNKQHSYTQNWHTSALDPSYPTIDTSTMTGRTNYEEGSDLIIAQANTDNLSLSLETGYSADAGDPTQYFCYTKVGTGDVMYNTVLYPEKSGNDAEIKVSNIDTGVNPAVASAMNINLFKNNEDGLNVVYYNSFEEMPQQRTFGDYETNAANIMIEQDVDEIPSVIAMYNGSLFLKDGQEIVSSDRTLNSLEVLYDGKTAKITSKDDNIKDASLVIKAPYKIENVLINGEAVFYDYSDGKIYINNTSGIDTSLDKGYLFKIPAKKGDTTFTVTIDIPENSVKTGELEYPTCVLENNVFKINFGSGTLSSCAKITVSGHTSQSVTEIIDGTSKTINTVVKTGSTLEEANSAVSEQAPVLERAREDLIIWTKDIAGFNVGTASSSSNQGGNTGSSGSSSSGSSGGGGVSIKEFPKSTQATLPPTPEETAKPLETAKPEETAKPAEENSERSFTDCTGHWAEDDIDYMHENGYVSGVSNELFSPDTNITRAEFAVMAARVMDIEPVKYGKTFDDVNEDDWYADYVEAAYESGIISGDGEYFRPNDNITRQEMAVILTRIQRSGESDKTEITFSDWDQVADWAQESVEKAVSLGLLKGMDDNMFAPNEYATRAQAASVFRRVIAVREGDIQGEEN